MGTDAEGIDGSRWEMLPAPLPGLLFLYSVMDSFFPVAGAPYIIWTAFPLQALAQQSPR